MAPNKNTHTSRTNKEDESFVDRSAATQVGQAIEYINNLTQRLPRPRMRPHLSSAQGVPASPERINVLVRALGTPDHPDHARAVDHLVAIGSPAVAALCEALETRQPWLAAYRAAEALGYIGNGDATSALLQALAHPNSNVRWSVVRALAHIGDLRAVFELRRVAAEDHGRTSWGESVAGTAQSALDQMRSRSLWGQGLELIKTAITCVLMILSLVLAFSVVTTLRSELDRVGVVGADGQGIPPQVLVPTPEGDEQGSEFAPLTFSSPTPTRPTLSGTPTPAGNRAAAAEGTVVQGANVRPFPSTQNQPIGELSQGDEILFLASSADGEWYLIRLGEQHAASSAINNPNGSASGWVNQALLSEPDGEVPVEEPIGSDSDPSPTSTVEN